MRSPSSPELSICIPTHHGRASTLRTTLRSILSQVDRSPPGSVEVCVSTGGPDDGTDIVIDEFSAGHEPTLTFRRAAADGGFGHHLRDAVDMASGAHVWLFSSDDAVAPGGIERVRRALSERPELVGLSCGVAMYDHELAQLVSDAPQFFFPPEPETPHAYLGPSAVTDNLGVIFAYFAAHVVRRTDWQAAVAEHRAAQGAWSVYFPHMDVFDRMIRKGLPWGWLPERVIWNRGGNDSWTPRRFGGDVSRYWIAILGDLDRLYRGMSGENREVVRRLQTTWIRTVAQPEQLAGYRLAPGAGIRRDVRMLAGLTRVLWPYRVFWSESFPTLITPRPVLHQRRGPT
jgi:glycosyltransferase involved in cell wall biosynthesis